MGGRDAGTHRPAGKRITWVSSLLRGVARAVFLSDTAQAVNQVVEQWRQQAAMRGWERRGRQLPPPHLAKQQIVRAYARAFGIDTLIETGTYLGAMIRATRGTFRRIVSIELDPHLYERARLKLSEPGRVTILNGDSAEVLPRVLAGIDTPCLFWLDAHHSGVLTAHGRLESPVVQELQPILSHPADHVVLIDDAHEFVGQGGYPTIGELKDMVAAHRPGWVVEVADDIIRLHRSRADAPAGGGGTKEG